MRWRVVSSNPEFRKLWIGQGVSAAGTAVTGMALPLVAVVGLGASAAEMGVLAALAVVPHLVLGLPAGVWVDRGSRRRFMVVADVGRAGLLAAIPLLAATGELRMPHLYVVAVLTGALTVVSDTASLALLPALVRREELVEANSASMLSQTLASTAGPAGAGLLIQLLSAPVAVAVDAVSYVGSAVASFLIKEPPRETPQTSWPRLDLTTGLKELFRDPVLAGLTRSATVAAVAGAMQGPLVVLYLVRELHWSPLLVGVAITTLGASSVFGTLIAPAYSNKLGIGPAYLIGQLIASCAGFALALAWWPLVFIGQVMTGLGMPLYGVPQRALRQALVPDHLLGRTTAAWRTLVIGGQTVGALAGGLVGTLLDLRAALVLSSLGMLAGLMLALLSPVKTLRQLPSTG
ncbi:MFS transporter [Kribbella sp. ALI-6-A]|uniref:MFS transporter n=1 Tax=Kribbella sp. ALI-6-A TaxID=1933817 RepID=UPI00143D8C51|nr:MFS transporter [Kribbella sp. ALI-6-A]